MNILVLGSGAREEAIAWSLRRTEASRARNVFVAPGNGGSAQRLSVSVTDPESVVALCVKHHIDLVVIGPESALEAGVSDALRTAGIATFGPSREAARLETSKGYCRDFATRHSIPGPVYKVFSGADGMMQAKSWANAQPFDVVVKADGLMAGKGVVIPTSREERDEAIDSIGARGSFVLEERMVGEEVSLLAFADGVTVRPMPPARDHKRIGEADTGANTGGMGVYAPTRLCPPELVDEIVRTIVQPAVDGLCTEGNRYVGVLYAGVMLTPDGPRLVEFNCRFGDPEAQALLPLLETDLLSVLEACVTGRLNECDISWTNNTTCAVVLAAHGYPVSPRMGDVVTGFDALEDLEHVALFHAGTERTESALVVSGGRVVTVTAIGETLPMARERAYRAASHIEFDGKYLRRDIGWRELACTTGGYAASGVDVDEGNRAVSLMKQKVEATHTPNVLGGVGAFGGTLAVGALRDMDDPVLVASTDGVGTKVMLAAEIGRYDTIGHDIVNHCVDDILVQRAYPMFFLDYFASSHISATRVAEVVGGMADACAANGCVLLGGETAEMPGVYHDGHFDVAGTMVGYAERARLLPKSTLGPGDVFIGVASSGLHTNGYSLVRRIFAGLPYDVVPEGMSMNLGDALLAPHRSYLPVLRELLATDLVKGLIHITGGGFQENIPRVLPADCGARVNTGSWPLPPLFRLIKAVSGLDDNELYRTFNMGIGMIVVVDAGDVDEVQNLIAEPTWVIGEIMRGNREVQLT